jgi:hypothetical protein
MASAQIDIIVDPGRQFPTSSAWGRSPAASARIGGCTRAVGRGRSAQHDAQIEILLRRALAGAGRVPVNAAGMGRRGWPPKTPGPDRDKT